MFCGILLYFYLRNNNYKFYRFRPGNMDKIFEVTPSETISNVVEGILLNLFNCKALQNDNIDHITEQTAKDDLKKLIENNDFNVVKLQETLQNSSWNSDKVSILVSLFNKHKTTILYNALLNHSSKYGETITDFDWILKLVLGTNELKTLSYPLLQLVLSTSTNGEQLRKPFDLNKDMLFKLINLLENIGDEP